MYSMILHCLVFSPLLLLILLDAVQSQGVNLGKLHWCNALCLCHDDTAEEMHCFQEQEIYALVQLVEKQMQRLKRTGFELQDKLMWCSETCLCHKDGQKEFRCTDKVHLGEFINQRAPFLSHYLEPEVETFDATDIIEKEEEEHVPSEEEAERKDRHERRKNRKHRKNRKKGHRDRKQEDVTEEALAPAPSTPPSVEEPVTPSPEENRQVLSAGIFGGGGSSNYSPTSTSSTGRESHTPVIEVPLERKTVAGKVANELEELRDNVNHIKEDVVFNQHMLLVAVVVAALAMIG